MNSFKKEHGFLSIVFLVFLAISIFAFIDSSNIDSRLYKQICVVLGLYFKTAPCADFYDLPFWEVGISIGTISAVFASFYILWRQRKDSKKNTFLSNQPFIISSDSIIFMPGNRPPMIDIKNIGVGPALFVRISYVPTRPDKPKNATLRADEPHSFYLEKGGINKRIHFDERKFYRFIGGSDQAGQWGIEINNEESIKRLTRLIKAKENEIYHIYFHVLNILETPIIFKAKCVLRINYMYSEDRLEFQLKRMEIRQLEGKIIL